MNSREVGDAAGPRFAARLMSAGAEKLAAAKERWLVLQEELTALDQA